MLKSTPVKVVGACSRVSCRMDPGRICFGECLKKSVRNISRFAGVGRDFWRCCMRPLPSRSAFGGVTNGGGGSIAVLEKGYVAILERAAVDISRTAVRPRFSILVGS